MSIDISPEIAVYIVIKNVGVGEYGAYASITAYEKVFKRLLCCSITLHCTRDEETGKGHTLKIDPSQ